MRSQRIVKSVKIVNNYQNCQKIEKIAPSASIVYHFWYFFINPVHGLEQKLSEAHKFSQTWLSASECDIHSFIEPFQC